MRLLNTTTLNFHEHVSDVPPYAILSHRWEEEEVTFEEYSLILECRSEPEEDIPLYLRKRAKRFEQKAGYRKILDFCSCAKANGLSWGWIDTCCIDKKSSAELSEAINSMWNWYAKSSQCHVFMSDVSSKYGIGEDEWELEFSNSQWFRRGWTLQELLAPRDITFHSKDWTHAGFLNKDHSAPTRVTHTHFIGSLEGATKIPRKYLELHDSHAEASVAQRMSWAAKRTTTRVEDNAYCLLGLFNINMPLLYGEGDRAFLRLQREILKQNDDPTILAWNVPCRPRNSYNYRAWWYCQTKDALAASPAWFERMGEGTAADPPWSAQPCDHAITISDRRLECSAYSTVLAHKVGRSQLDHNSHLYAVMLQRNDGRGARSTRPILFLLGKPSKPSRSADSDDTVMVHRRVLTCSLGEQYSGRDRLQQIMETHCEPLSTLRHIDINHKQKQAWTARHFIFPI